MPRCAGISNGSPNRSRRRASCALTAGWLRCSRLTATGPAVLAQFDDPQAYHGKTLPVIGEVLTAREIVDTFVRVTGRRAHYASAYAREDLLAHFPAFGADEWLVRELVGMVTYAVEYGYCAPERDTAWSRRNDPDALTWEGFLRRTGWRGEHTSFGAATRTAE